MSRFLHIRALFLLLMPPLGEGRLSHGGYGLYPKLAILFCTLESFLDSDKCPECLAGISAAFIDKAILFYLALKLCLQSTSRQLIHFRGHLEFDLYFARESFSNF